MGATGRTMRIRLSDRQATPHDDGRIGERHSRAPRKLSASPADAITTPDCRIVMTPAFCGFGKTLAQKQTGISECQKNPPGASRLRRRDGKHRLSSRRHRRDDAQKKGPRRETRPSSLSRKVNDERKRPRHGSLRLMPLGRSRPAWVEDRADRSLRAERGRPR